MADVLTKKQRSYCMSRIRGKWTAPERRLHNMLKGRHIRHKMHPAINGSPDLILADKKVAVFVHGCFWHGCPLCFVKPTSNKPYWGKKIAGNMKRDRANARRLRAAGYKVVVVWEHDLKGINKSLPVLVSVL